LGSAPVAVLTGGSISFNIAEPAVEKAIRAVYAEATAIAHKLGAPVALDVETWITNARKLAHKPSILQDLELGRKMEVATMFDAPLALARIAGVETPTLDLILALARLRSKSAGLCG
jgi:2-dehydropantoate 2-reductase